MANNNKSKSKSNNFMIRRVEITTILLLLLISIVFIIGFESIEIPIKFQISIEFKDNKEEITTKTSSFKLNRDGIILVGLESDNDNDNNDNNDKEEQLNDEEKEEVSVSSTNDDAAVAVVEKKKKKKKKDPNDTAAAAAALLTTKSPPPPPPPSSLSKSSSSSKSKFMQFLEDEHPECLVLDSLDDSVVDDGNNQNRQIIDIKRDGKYIYKPMQEEPYDHLSCFIMKSRYNCAQRHSNKTAKNPKDMAYNYRFVFSMKDNNNSTTSSSSSKEKDYCDVQSVLKEFSTTTTKDDEGPSLLPSNTYVLIQGNSFLRQVYESIICLFMNQIVSSTVNINGPTLNLKSAEEGHLFTTNELGTQVPLTSNIMKEGCHAIIPGTTAYHKKYKGVIEPPKPTMYCTDNIATTTFHNNITFNYIFNPREYSYDAMEKVYRERFHILSSNSNDIDIFIYNSYRNNVTTYGNTGNNTNNNTIPSSSKQQQQQQGQRQHPKWIYNFNSVLDSLKYVQNKYIGYYFGADNPWLTTIPDKHPCMPGMVDDQTFMLLFSLLTGYEFH